MRTVERSAIVFVLLNHSIPNVKHNDIMTIILRHLNATCYLFNSKLEIVQTLNIVTQCFEKRVGHHNDVVLFVKDT